MARSKYHIISTTNICVWGRWNNNRGIWSFYARSIDLVYWGLWLRFWAPCGSVALSFWDPDELGPTQTVPLRFIQTSAASKKHPGRDRYEPPCIAVAQFSKLPLQTQTFSSRSPCTARRAFLTRIISLLAICSHISGKQLFSPFPPLNKHSGQNCVRSNNVYMDSYRAALSLHVSVCPSLACPELLIYMGDKHAHDKENTKQLKRCLSLEGDVLSGAIISSCGSCNLGTISILNLPDFISWHRPMGSFCPAGGAVKLPKMRTSASLCGSSTSAPLHPCPGRIQLS